jgi:hypothetical protein
MTIHQVQMPRGPLVISVKLKVVKIPVVMEMKENAIAKLPKERNVRRKSC